MNTIKMSIGNMIQRSSRIWKFGIRFGVSVVVAAALLMAIPILILFYLAVIRVLLMAFPYLELLEVAATTALFTAISYLVLPIVFLAKLTSLLWRWLHMGEMTNNSEVIRNIFLVVGGMAALLIANWRSRTADKHQKTAHLQQKKEAQARLNERFKSGSEMLGDEETVVCMSGITILEQLSKEKPKKFHLQVVNLLGNFIKYPKKDANKAVVAQAQEALKAIGRRTSKHIRKYSKSTSSPVDISRSNLDDIRLNQGNFEGINFWRSTFRNAIIDKSKFASTFLARTNFNHASFIDVDFSNSNLAFTNISYANLKNVKFINAKLLRAKFMHSKFKQANFSNSFANFSKFLHATLIEANFSDASLENANFFNANLTKATFTNASLKGAKLREADLQSADFRGVDLSGANLSGAKNLTQEQLDVACQSSDKSPEIDECLRWNKYAALNRYEISRGPTYYWKIFLISGMVENHRTPRAHYDNPRPGERLTVNGISVKVIGDVSSDATKRTTFFAEEV